jgi:hypothetical protein
MLIDDEISLRTTKKIQEMHNAATKLLPKLEGGGGGTKKQMCLWQLLFKLSKKKALL